MSQRNSSNDRNLHGGPEGSTRKSAARVKPKLRASDSVRTTAKPTDKKSKKALEKVERRKSQEKESQTYSIANAMMEQVPEYRFWKRVWWGMMIFAILATLGSWFVQLRPELPQAVLYGSLGVAYIGIIGALVVDLVKVRPIRKAKRAEAAKLSKRQLATIINEQVDKTESKQAARAQKKEKLFSMFNIKKARPATEEPEQQKTTGNKADKTKDSATK